MNESTFSVRCEGCLRIETHPWHGPGKEWLEQIEEMKERGWIHRTFMPNIKAWFCSEECAYQSRYAKSVEKYWGLDILPVEELVKDASNFSSFWIILASFFLLALSLVLGDCLHVRL